MTLWMAVVLAGTAAFVLKLLGYLIPPSWLAGDRTTRITTLLPVSLLAALVVVQTVTGPAGALTLDARFAAVAMALILLALRANFLVVVFAAAATAALLRAMGWLS